MANEQPKMIDVEILGSTEARGVVQLADGAKVSVRAVFVSAFKAEGQTDHKGQPVYSINSQLVLTLVEPPKT